MNKLGSASEDPHRGQPVLTAGRSVNEAEAAMILIHGRGATAGSILQLAAELDRPEFAFVAPQAAQNAWYPYSFLAPVEQNEPNLSSALRLVGTIVDDVLGADIPRERLMLLGFSQGACLTLEFTARNAGRYGGVVGLTGGLIGPDETPRNYKGQLEGTPVFIGTSDPDPHVPISRVEETASVLERMGARVNTRVYPGLPHTINEDELKQVRSIMDQVLSGSANDRAAP
ncbi:MAG TPA: dienelactone hydrolase family protein [Longimicrobiaceae bacterium]|nr:dienelactone hydrolase family protein [Longimicrobiaceae bacterium]